MERQNSVKKLFKKVGFVLLLALTWILLIVGLALLYNASPKLGEYASIGFLVLPVLTFLKPMPAIKLGHRGYSVALLLIVGLPMTAVTQQITLDRREAEFAALKASNPNAYLAALKDYDVNRWLNELEAIAPEQHAAEIVRIAEVEALRLEMQAQKCGTSGQRLLQKQKLMQLRPVLESVGKGMKVLLTS